MAVPNVIDKYDEVKRMTRRLHLTDDGKVKRLEFILDDPIDLVDFSVMRIVAPAPPQINRGTPQGVPVHNAGGNEKKAPRPCSGGGG